MDNLGSMQSADESVSADSKKDRDRKRREVDRDIVIAESDMRKIIDEKGRLEMEIRSHKKEESQIKVALQEKRMRLTKIDQELFMLENEVKRLKKKLNTL